MGSASSEERATIRRGIASGYCDRRVQDFGQRPIFNRERGVSGFVTDAQTGDESIADVYECFGADVFVLPHHTNIFESDGCFDPPFRKHSI